MIYETERDQGIDASAGEHPRKVTPKNDLDALQKAVSMDSDYQGLVESFGQENGSATRKASCWA